MDPQIIFEDNSLLVINKPSGMIVNKADTTRNEITVQDWIEKKYHFDKPKGLTEKTETGDYNKEYEFYNRGGIVHRLDKETSGILVIAKDVDSFTKLQQQFKERTVKKIYIAVAHGKILPEIGEIHAPVGRLEWNRKRFGVVSGGREAVTRYKTISNFQFTSSNKKTEDLTYLELYPKTGRTHQIRVHLKYINHPIFSDILYAGRKTVREDRKYLSRLFLHAKQLTFIHPMSLEEMTFDAALTPDLEQFIQSLQ